MNALPVIENACREGMDEDTPDGLSIFRSLVGPEDVMEMAQLLRLMLDFIEKEYESPKARQEMITYAKATLRMG